MAGSSKKETDAEAALRVKKEWMVPPAPMSFFTMDDDDSKIHQLVEEFKEVKKDNHEREAIASTGIEASEEELLDRISRTRKATEVLLMMLPTWDKTDRKRLTRARIPAGEPVE